MSSQSPDDGVPAAATAPKPPKPLGPVAADFFSEKQWAVLMSIMDAVVPSLPLREAGPLEPMTQLELSEAQFQEALELARSTMVEPPSEELLKAYLQDRPSDYPDFLVSIQRTLANVPSAAQKQLGAILSALSTKTGSLLLTGYTTPFHEQPIHIRHAILLAWSKAWLGFPRTLFKTFTVLAKAGWIQNSSMFPQVTQYPEYPEDYKPGPTQEFGFLQFPDADEPAVVETDVVIVGSGPGGSVCAKVLAEAGHSVLVVDKGYYFPPSHLPMPQTAGGTYLFENGGLSSSIDTSIGIVAGSCWGGGGTINWSVSLQTQGYVRREWAEDYGLPFFASAEFQACLDRVCDFMGVADPQRQSHRGQLLLDGSRKLGWHAKPCPQNSGKNEHWCGHCHLGCGSGQKQGPTVSWLPAAQKAGARFIEGFAVDKVLWDTSSTSKKAIGITGIWTSRDADGSVSSPPNGRRREVVVRAKKVIVSSGSLNSPLLLQRSGLTNRHIGQNLHLHPVNFVAAYYKDDVKPWEGGIITSVTTSFENLDGHGHGVKLEANCMLPFTNIALLPWRGALDFKLATMRYRHMNVFIALTRDRDTGRVVANPDTGGPSVDYTPSAFDAAHTLEGVIALAKICYITGATEIRVFLPDIEPFVRADADAAQQAKSPPDMDLGVSDPAFVEWLGRVRAAGNVPPYAAFGSAHQMGTCRMSSHAAEGVVDPRGRVWDAEDLYVADASVFPSASGVNPMVTNMAIADWIANGVHKDLRRS